MTAAEAFTLAAAAVAAGLVNALAGGGSLISFPALLGVGLPGLVANVTNTVALTPGYLGASLGQLNDLQGQRRRLLLLMPAALAGGVLGASLLLRTGERLFTSLVPWLILTGAGLLAGQDPLKRRLQRTDSARSSQTMRWWAGPAVVAACVYGGYFGAGLSVIVLAVLAIGLDDNLNRLSGLKQTIALSANLSASLVFLATGHIAWTAALVMAAGSIAGGLLGGRLAGRVNHVLLRRMVVGCAVAIGLVYLWRSTHG